MIEIKRAYDEPAKEDGFRILVERLRPRGLRKNEAAIDVWLKEIAPSTPLRQWYGHDVARWPEFKKRYEGELRLNQEVLHELEEYCQRHPITTFVYAAHDEEHNSAVVLRAFIERRLSGNRRKQREARSAHAASRDSVAAARTLT